MSFFLPFLKGTDALNGIFHLQPDNSWGTRKALSSQTGKLQTSSTFSRQPDNTSTTNATNSQGPAAPERPPQHFLQVPKTSAIPTTHRDTGSQHQPAQALKHSDYRAPSFPPLPFLPQSHHHHHPRAPHHHATQDLMPPNPTYHHQRSTALQKKNPHLPRTRAASLHPPPPPQLHNAPHSTHTAPRIYRESAAH